MTNLTKERITIFFIFLSIPFFTIFSQDVQYGLRFYSYSYEPEKRTSLDLSPNDYLSLPDGFSMNFMAKFNSREISSYGYVFRICDKKDRNIDLVLGDRNMSFSSSMGKVVLTKSLQEINLLSNQWIFIQLNVDVKSKKLKIEIGDIEQEWELPEIADFKQVNIVFGKNNYPKTQAIDVPDMTVKDIKIENLSGSLLYHWILSKHTTNGVYDEQKHYFAKVENPDWVLTQHVLWKKETTISCGSHPYITFNSDINTIAIADQHFFYTFSLNDGFLKKQNIKQGLSYLQYANQMIYNPIDSNYYAYNLMKEENGREFTAFDMQKSEWEETTAHHNYSDYWQHNRHISVDNRQLYIFGGYGHHKYKKGMYIYDMLNKKWTKDDFSGDNIEPRYLSGLGEINDSLLLLFGGYGSTTGNQDILPQHYYDAYIVDIKNKHSKKLWELEVPKENFVISNSLVVDTAANYFYALCYPFTKYNTELKLYKFSLDTPTCEILSDSILLGFKDGLSYVDLFFDPSNHKLLAITSSSVLVDSIASVSIYSLDYPPLKRSDLYQSEKTDGFKLLWIIATTVILLSTVCVFFFLRKRKRKIVPTIYDELNESLLSQKFINDSVEPVTGIATVKDLRKQSIFLFGGFQVIDKDGTDLTAEFKPLHKSLFLLILLNTIKTGKGISFVKLKELLWFDKTEESANNNRGVAMTKIRQILENVGKVEFNKQGIYWSVEFGKEFYCDYYEALILIRKIKESTEVNIDDIKRLLLAVSSGEFLPNMQVEWADAFKAEFSDELVDLLMNLIHKEDAIFSDTIRISIANAIFIHDPINEDALKLKCSILVKMGKNGLARNAYTLFVKEYTAWFSADYKYSFEQIIQQPLS